MKDTTKIVTSFAAVPNEKHIIWRIVRFARNLAARGTSALEAKVLTTGPPVVPYASVIRAGLSSTLLYMNQKPRWFKKMKYKTIS